MNKNKIALIDIDGTLANIKHRLHFIVCPYVDQYLDFKKDWDGFNGASDGDTPIQEIIDLVNIMYDSYKIILVTARMEHNREATIRWLSVHNIRYDDLRMRHEGDYRPDYIVKPTLLSKDELENTVLAIDDRTQVVDMWRKLNIRTLQCAKGDF